MKPRHFWWLVEAKTDEKKAANTDAASKDPLTQSEAKRLHKWVITEQKYAA